MKRLGNKKRVLALLLCATVLLLQGIPPERAQAAPAALLYVSPGGSGTACSSVAPCSLALARSKAQAINDAAQMNGNIFIYLKDGTYELGETFVLNGEDSGSNHYSVIYKNAPGETPILSGGTKITGWQTHQGSIVKANVGMLEFRQLYVNDVRAIRARTPNRTSAATLAGYYQTVKVPVQEVPAQAANPYQVNASELANWAQFNQVEFVWLAHFRQKRARLDSYAPAGNGKANLTFMPQEQSNGILNHHNQYDPAGGVNTYHYYENAYEFLDSPGEWYLNNTTGVLYYMLKPGETKETIQVVVPLLETLVRIEGTQSAPAERIGIEGITFKHTTWTLPDSYGYLDTQAAREIQTTGTTRVALPGAIEVNNARSIRIEGNTIEKTGAHGIYMEGMLANNVVFGNTLRDLSAGGIYVDSTTSAGDVVSSNSIEAVGRDYADAVGIFASQPTGMSIEFNRIAGAPYTGISLGWDWDDSDNGIAGNMVQYNDIGQAMQLLDDGAAIYTLGRMDGTEIKRNYIHDMTASNYQGKRPKVGIYLDQGSKGKSVFGNVISSSGDARISAFFADYDGGRMVSGNAFYQNDYNVPYGKISTPQNTTDYPSGYMSGTGWPSSAANAVNGAGPINNRAVLVPSTQVFASTTLSSYVPKLAADGSTDAYGWSSCGTTPGGACTDSGPYWMIDLGGSYRIRKIEIVSRLGTIDQETTRKNFVIRAKNANSDLSTGATELARVSDTAFPHGSTWSKVIEDTSLYRYVAIIKSPVDYFYLNEVRIYV